MAVTRKFSPNRWARDAAYRADYVHDLIERMGEELGTLGWSVAPFPAWGGEIDRSAEARLEQFDNDDQMRFYIDPKARTVRVCHLDASLSEERWSFETALATPAEEIAASIRTR